MTDFTPVIKIKSNKILIILCLATLALVALSVLGQAIKYGVIYIYMGGPWNSWKEFGVDLLMQSFFMDWEGNIPTYFNTIILFLPALLFALIHAWKKQTADKFRFHWLGLAVIFLLLSIDEAASLHERLIKPMRDSFNYEGYSGIFFFAWIIPGLIVVGLFALTYLRFFLSLNKKDKLLFFFSITLYVGGVIGGEMLSGHLAETIGQKNFTYAALTSVEESLEFFGASLLAYWLLEYIKDHLPNGIQLKTE